MASVGIEGEKGTVFEWEPAWPAGFGALVEPIETRFPIVGRNPFAEIYVRAGAFTDANGNTGWSTSGAIYLDHRVLIDLAYQNNNFPEIAREFGSSRILNACVTVRW